MRTYTERARESVTRDHESYLDNPVSKHIIDALKLDHWTGWALIDAIVRDDLPDGPHGLDAAEEFDHFQEYITERQIVNPDRTGLFLDWMRRMGPFAPRKTHLR